MRKFFLKNNFSKIWGIHPSQQASLNTNLISVDLIDNKIGEINKINAHLNEYNYSEKASPHRAFSLFIFDQEYNLLLQQRSNHKITFRNQWANSCCSHQIPILDEIDKYENSIQIGKNRSEFELNLDVEHAHFELISKILYKAKADETWGEYELDYLYFLKLNEIKPKINQNLEEVRETVWISQDLLMDFKDQQNKLGYQFTPWFNLITRHKLINWWGLYKQGKLSTYVENDKIEYLE